MFLVKPNVYPLIKELEKRRGRDYEKQELARLIGITRPTLDGLIEEDRHRDRMEMATMGKLLAFFHSQGMPVTLNDLFVVTNDELKH